MPIEIDLVYFEGCPHVDAARAALRAVLAEPKSAGWREWRTDDPQLPEYAKGYGSPSIFVGGRELMGERPAASSSACRLYQGRAGGPSGAPSLELLAAALQEALR